MNVRLLHEAEVEFWNSVEYYECSQAGLGIRFQREVDRCLKQIAQHAMLARVRRKGYRRVNLTEFRHYIAYVIREEIIWVIAICHSHQKPEFWLHRLPK